MSTSPDPIAAAEARARSGGLTIAALCERAGIAPSTWTRWKQRKHLPNLRTWMRIEAVLDAQERDAKKTRRR